MQVNRVTNIKDIKKLTSLLHQAYAADVALGIHFAASTVTESDVLNHVLSTPTFALQDERGTIIATASVRLPWSNNPGPFGLPHIGWVATNPAYQQQGFAKQMIKWVINHYIKPELQTPAVTIGTAADHPWLQSFYQSIGFKTIDITQMPNGPKAAFLISIFDEERTRSTNNTYLNRVLSEKTND